MRYTSHILHSHRPNLWWPKLHILNTALTISQGIPSPPQSPPLAARHMSATVKNTNGPARRGGAAYTITGECERLFCETLRAVFLGEGNLARQDSLVLGVQKHEEEEFLSDVNDYGVDVRRYNSGRIMDSPSPEAVGAVPQNGMIGQWVEIWDYVGGNKFRGFVADDKTGERAMFVFFDQSVVGGDLKAG